MSFITDLEAALLGAVETDVLTVRDTSIVLCARLGGCVVSLMAYEVINKKPLQVLEFTPSTGDACG
jgi:hypothetical protein